MGVLTRIRNGIGKAAGRSADALSSVSQLSPEQVREIDDRRLRYLSEMPSMDNELAVELTRRNIGAISIEINNAYLPQISKIYAPIQERPNFPGNDLISFFEVSKWVKDPNEDNIEKLMNVYQVLSEEECNIALIYNRTKKDTKIYLAVVNNGRESDPSEVESYKKRLFSALKGNFPGADCILEGKNGFGQNVPRCLWIEDEKPKSVACVSNLAAEKSEKFISQTIEKVLDGIVPADDKEEYTMVLLATPINNQVERINRLYELYTALAPYVSWQTNFTFTEVNTTGASATFGLNIGTSAGTQSGSSHSDANTDSTANSKSNSTMDSKTKGWSANVGYNGTGVGKQGSRTHGTSVAKSVTKTVARTATEAVSKGLNFGINAGVSFARGSNVSTTLGKNEGITQTFTNYGIKHTLENLELQIKRLEESAALGLWDFAAYVLSGSSEIANNVAHTYMALTQGDRSYLSEAAVNLWRADLPSKAEEREKAKVIHTALSRLQHPEFCLSFGERNTMPEEYLMYPSCVTSTVSLSGKELARALNFPGKSVCGIPVIETASFGRNVSSYNEIAEDLRMGSICHMHIKEDNVPVNIGEASLTSHVFVTGSTGTGKTNTVAKMIKNICLSDYRKDVPTFLVIEPAKGEYKSLLGGYDSVKVYGTNPKISELLQINPFSFPKNITVSEHIDRLIEIFNVCWPMYAAMPAILKDAVISAYEIAGWNIETSSNAIRDDLYPGFVDVMEQVQIIVSSSAYSSDSKGDYTGALLSRIKSLTNGINGQIFCTDAKTDEELFDSNVIVDLSRVGAVDTKSLIMGLLMLKLQEYRLSEKAPDRKNLEHITVLEEAHNLLRRTSLEQSGESSNLLGKSVEMITNAIAELRAFGEGFIIADQAPGLLDMAVIRNTNTKIIHKLPDQTDRELVGKAVGLNDAQINELSKLERGVAAIYQNDWTEAVLCKIDEFTAGEQKANSGTNTTIISQKDIHKELVDYLVGKEIVKEGNRADLSRLAELVIKSQMSARIKANFLQYISADSSTKVKYLRKVMFDLLNVRDAVEKADKEDEVENWVEKLVDHVNPSLRGYPEEQIKRAVGLLIQELYERDGSHRRMYQAYTSMIERGVK